MDSSGSRILSAILFYANLVTINASQCVELTKPTHYFNVELVLGKPWRIYHTWNMKMEMMCLDMTFKNATLEIVNRIYDNMTKYVKHQPNWDAAALLITSGTGTAEREMLLLADKGNSGSFLGVPNVMHDEGAPTHKKIHIHKFFLKLLHYGSLLLMADCTIGATTLSAQEKPPCRAEVASIVSTLPLGEGDSACISENDENEHMYT